MMKIKLIVLALTLLSPLAFGERVIPEDILNSWGYKTTQETPVQFIKKLDRLPIEGKAYYSRYTLSKECFENEKSAAIRLKEINEQSNRKNMKIGYTGELFVVGKCIYNLDAHMFRYYDQKQLLSKYQEYIQSIQGNVSL